MTRTFSLTLVLSLCAVAGAARGAALEFTSPAGGDKWAVGSQHYVTWKSADVAADAKLQLSASLDAGKTWTEVAAVPNTGKFLWTVPDKAGGDVRLRLASGATTAESKPAAIIPSQAVPEYKWTQVTLQAAFAPRDGAGALTFKDKMYFIGGWNPGDKKFFPRICNNEVWSSTDGAAWTLVKPNTFLDASFKPEADWEGRHTAGYLVYQDKMWIIGGDVNQGHYMFDVWNSTDGKTWNLVNKGKPVPWGPRALHYCFVLNDKMWVLGGQTIPGFAAGDELFHHDVWNSTDGIEWKKVEMTAPFEPQRGMIGGMAVKDGRVWILGGGTYDTPKIRDRKFYSDVWSSADGAKWTRHVEQAPWDPRQYHDVAVYDDRLWVMEGYYKANRKDVWYSQDGVNWYEVPNTPWAPRHAASVYVHDGSLWMVAGNNMQPDAWRLSREKN